MAAANKLLPCIFFQSTRLDAVACRENTTLIIPERLHDIGSAVMKVIVNSRNFRGVFNLCNVEPRRLELCYEYTTMTGQAHRREIEILPILFHPLLGSSF